MNWDPPGEFTSNATAFTFLKLNALVKESDRSLRLRLFLLPNLPSGEIMPDNFIKAIIGVLAKNNFFPFCYNKINLVVTKYIYKYLIL